MSPICGAIVKLFISYAWTSDAHREWVNLLAAHLKAVGYEVLIDADVDYSDSLNGFMRRATESDHVLLVVDENYVERADNQPTSGVGVETHWLSSVFDAKPQGWLGILLRGNPKATLPKWLTDEKPRGFDFNAVPAQGRFPGSAQVEELWRWIEGLPGRRDSETTVAMLRARARRLEEIDTLRNPGNWHSPATSGEILFDYEWAPGKTYGLGHGEYSFGFTVSERSRDVVAVYSDPVKAVGISRGRRPLSGTAEDHLTPGRVVDARPGDSVLLLNEHGAMCWIDLLEVTPTEDGEQYRRPLIRFQYEILLAS
jgi:hypothetical protein